jgi:hypothetical protein
VSGEKGESARVYYHMIQIRYDFLFNARGAFHRSYDTMI